MQEVSARAIGVFTDLVRKRGIDASEVTRGVRGIEGVKNGTHGRIDWDVCCELAERTEQLLGGQEALDQAFAASAVGGDVFQYFRRIAGLCVSVRQAYWMTEHWFGPSMFPHIRSRQTWTSDGRIEQRLDIPEPYRACAAFLRINAAALRAVPLTLGLPPAQVDLDITPRAAVIRIIPPPQATVWTGLRRAWRLATGAGTALVELQRQEQELRERFTELQTAHAQIIEHARALRQANIDLQRARDTLEQRVVERTAELQETSTKLEVALRERERIDAERTQFFANASHELRTPLTLLLPVLEELREAPGLLSELGSAVRHALRSGYRMARLVNDLLDVSKGEAGQLRLFPTPVDLVGLLRQALEPWRVPLERRGVRLEVDLPDELVLDLDAERIEAVAWNLLANASRFVPDDGRIALELREAEGRIVCTISNSGPWIAPDDLARVFERFGQATDSPMRRYGTTGLGLAVVKEIAVLHGGDVEAENVAEGGVTFRVWLPRQLPSAAVASRPDARPSAPDLARLFSPELDGPPSNGVAQRSSASEQPRRRLLVVEDQDELRAELCRMLGSEFDVLAAADGLEALRLCRAEHPDLVLSDVMMPGLDGLGLVRELKADATTSAIPVVLLTARSDLDTKLTGLGHGADDYVVKPFHLEELRARLRVQLRLRDLGVELAERERLALLGTLVAGVAHELRNPLNGILNTVLPARAMVADGSDELKTLLDLAAVSARRVEALSQRLLLMARAGEGPRTRVDVLETVRLAARMVQRPRGAGPTIEIRASVDPTPWTVLGEPGALMHVWVNLLDNACRATELAGRVIAKVEASAADVVVEVQDDGPGVPEVVAARIFEPFFTTRAAGEGTGLGLALAHKTVTGHGGSIELVPSRPGAGKGACFRVRLPRDRLVVQGAGSDSGPGGGTGPAVQREGTDAGR